MESSCEVCQNVLHGPTLNLGTHPLCDDLIGIDANARVPKYLQEIQLCSICLTAHQLHPVKKELLFKPDYHYRAGITKDVISGMQDLAKESLETFNDKRHIKAIDIGCNDGSLLKIIKGLRPQSITIGVEPTNAILEARNSIDYTINDFFNNSVATQVFKKFGTIDLITFTNVFAHIENLPTLLKNLKMLIGPKTKLVIENHYLGSILDIHQFDTFYHEHPRTYSVTSFRYIAESLGMNLENVTFPRRYGGNIRVIISSNKKLPEVEYQKLIAIEQTFTKEFSRLQKVYEEWQEDSMQVIRELTNRHGVIYGKSLPGRAVMLISSLGLDETSMPFIFEQDSSPKINYLVPGTKTKIVSDKQIETIKPKSLVIWAWHIAGEVRDYLRSMGYKGEVWKPLPKFELFDVL